MLLVLCLGIKILYFDSMGSTSLQIDYSMLIHWGSLCGVQGRQWERNSEQQGTGGCDGERKEGGQLYSQKREDLRPLEARKWLQADLTWLCQGS